MGIQLFSLLCSWSAIIFSIVLLVGKAPMSAEGNVLTIVSICVTLIVGVSVVDSLAVHRHGEQLGLLEHKMEEVEQLKKDMADAKERDDMLRMATYMSWGLALLREEPLAAFEQFQKMLTSALDDKRYVDEANKAIDFMGHAVNGIKQQLEKDGDSLKHFLKEKHLNRTPEEIQLKANYNVFKDRIDKIYQSIAVLM